MAALIGDLARGEHATQHRVDEEREQPRQNDRGEDQSGRENSELCLVRLALLEPGALRALDLSDQLARLSPSAPVHDPSGQSAAAAASPRRIVGAPRALELRELFGDDGGERVEPALLRGIGDQSARGCERAMHVRRGASAGIEIMRRTGEQISALRRLGVGEPREHGVQRLG